MDRMIQIKNKSNIKRTSEAHFTKEWRAVKDGMQEGRVKTIGKGLIGRK
jgi:hypothetical protein